MPSPKMVSDDNLALSFNYEIEPVWLVSLGDYLVFRTVTFVLNPVDDKFNHVVV
jgi:hypothetical protein